MNLVDFSLTYLELSPVRVKGPKGTARASLTPAYVPKRSLGCSSLTVLCLVLSLRPWSSLWPIVPAPNKYDND